MKHWSTHGALLVFLAAGVPAAQAAGIDCAKARSPSEKAICASPRLLVLDQQIAAAYAEALVRQPQRKDATRQDLVRWLKQRDAACALPAADITECLTRQMTARLADLAPPAATAAPAPPAATAAPAPAASAAPPATPPAARPTDPPVPPDPTPQAAATLEQTSLPAAEHADTMLHVTSAGRFAITAQSPSGTSLQLIDMLTGPGQVAGVPGAQDGRLDALLDVGTYKLRIASDKTATGTVALSVTPFHAAAPPAALPPPGFPIATSLADGEQRAFWLTVPPDGSVRIEAAGRALGDLRLWRDGRDLTALEPAPMRSEPVAGHPLTDLRLQGKVEPGTYLAVAYGGPALPWTDNDPTQPFLLRAGASPALAEGWAAGPIGPFGSEVYDLPPATGLLRLSLPAAATAELRAGDAIATITRTSRDPTVHLELAPGRTPAVEVRAAAGQPFTLQALEQPATRSIDHPGTYWVSAVVNGAGGDEIPAGVLLQRTEAAGKPPRIIASTLPRVGPGAAWHARFNLRGQTTLLLQNTAGGELTVRSAGVAITKRGSPGADNLPADYYGLNLTPEAGAQGSLDLVVGPPGAAAPPLATLPPDPVVPFGVQTVAPGQTLQVLGPSAPGVQLGLSARHAPVALAEGPLTVTQATGTTLAIPVAIAPGGTLAVSEVGGGPIAFRLQQTGTANTVVVPPADHANTITAPPADHANTITAPSADHTPNAAAPPEQASTVVLPPSDHARAVVLAWRRTTTPIAIPAPRPPGTTAALEFGKPASLDLARGETTGFALTLPQGGLYRIETLGRLHTAGRLATAFIPRLQQAEANGIGQNMLIQQELRAGTYRVDVTALDSAGHLGLSVTPAPVLAGASLLSGASVRATLPAGSAIAFPLTVAGPGDRYRLDVSTLGPAWQGRIEDAQGWPMTSTGPLDNTVQTLPPGTYRLVISPTSVDRQVVARLTALTDTPDLNGHGPHKLPFETPQTATWREPDGRDQPRTPDAWTFDLAGPADIALDPGEGMVADLRRDTDPAPLARIAGHYTGTLEAGHYRLDATSLGRNDRLAYTISLASKSLQPGIPRTVALPASLGFAIAEPRVVSLTSFGNTPVKAVLRRADGTVVARVDARADDWNIAASRPLPAGSYRLDVAAANPPGLSTEARPPAPGQANDDKDTDDKDADTSSDQPSPSPAADKPDDPDAPAPRSTEIRLALPDRLPAAAAPAEATELTGAGVHILTLSPPPPGRLLLAQATSSAALVLALEHYAGTEWHVVAQDEGTAPIVAAPVNAGPLPWRIEVWAVDGGAEPIQVAARAVDTPAQPLGPVSLAPIPGMPAPLAVARLALDGPAPLVIDPPTGLLAGSWEAQALAVPTGPVLPRGQTIWLLGREPATATVAKLAFSEPQPITVPPGQAAQLPPAAPGEVAIWRAESGFGQPSLGPAAGIAPASAIAQADRPIILRNGGGERPLRLTLARQTLDLLPARALDAALQTTLPPGTALPIQLPAGDKLLQADLGAEVAAFAGEAAIWAGSTPVSRTLSGSWTDILLVNAGTTPAPASLSWQPAPPAAPLQSGGVIKRFFGASGSFEVSFDAAAGARLATAGNTTLTAILADGTVRRGHDIPASGTGRLIVEHGIGPIALWLSPDGAFPWPEAAPQPVTPPASLALTGPAMALALQQPEPTLLHVSTTAPVLASLIQVGRSDPPRLFAAGAELHLMLAAGPAELRLSSPTDGPLTGTLALSTEPIQPITEGLGAPTAVAPGHAALFSFSLANPATIGVGVRAEPDRATVRLLDASGTVLGAGVAQLRALPAGQYMIEAEVPPDAAPTILRPAVVGITPRGSGPPPDVAAQYLELVGLKPAQGTSP